MLAALLFTLVRQAEEFALLTRPKECKKLYFIQLPKKSETVYGNIISYIYKKRKNYSLYAYGAILFIPRSEETSSKGALGL